MRASLRSRLPLVAAALGLLAASAGSVSAAGNPNATFSFTICQTTVPELDPETGEPTGADLPALELHFDWSGAYVDTLTASWTRTDGGDVFFGVAVNDFPAGRSGSVNAGTFTIDSETPELDGLAGGFNVRRHTVALRAIAEPAGGWETVTACD
jgi:hypothetical protein